MKFSRIPLQHHLSPHRKVCGFTLAELLVVLAILGVIVTLILPRLITGSEDLRYQAVLKETIAAVQEIYREGSLNRAYANTTIGTYLQSKLNAVQLCSTNARTQGCWTAAQGDYFSEETEPGAILASGASIAGIANTTGSQVSFVLDANGDNPPNTMGQDQIYVGYCIGPASCTTLFWSASTRPRAPGAMGPVGNAASSDLFNRMFAR